jgi:hypothetical protein
MSLAAFPFGLKSNRHALDQAPYQHQFRKPKPASIRMISRARIGDNLALVG